jgi:hypothetical protein
MRQNRKTKTAFLFYLFLLLPALPPPHLRCSRILDVRLEREETFSSGLEGFGVFAESAVDEGRRSVPSRRSKSKEITTTHTRM